MLTTAMLRKNNMLEILKAIKRSRLVSRPEIAQQTGLTSVTVSTVIAELMKNGIVVEEGLADSIGGRKAALYRFNEGAYCVIGVDIRVSHIDVALFDLGANVLARGATVHIREGQSVEATLTAMLRGIRELIAESKKSAPEIIGIGVSVPGRVDYKNGVVSHLTNMKNWVNIPLRDIIQSETGITTYIERDTNAHISYLKWLDHTENRPNVVYCEIGEGLGAAVMIDGAVFRGEHGLAGEVGHTIVDLDGPHCNCGNRGCVEMFASNKAIIGRFLENCKAQNVDGDQELLSRLEGYYDENEAIDLLVRLALSGDAAADVAFKGASRYCYAFLVSIINTYNPSLILVECRWMKQVKKYFNEVVSQVFDRNTLLDRNDVKIALNPVEGISSSACSTIVLEQLFSGVENNRLIG